MNNPKDIDLSTPLRELKSGAVSSFIVNILGVLCAILLQIILARALGVKGFGIYSYVLSWLSVLVILATAGLDVTLLRFVSIYVVNREWGLLRGIISKSSLLCAFFSLSVSLLLLLGVFNLGAESFGQELGLCFVAGAFLLPLWAQNNLRQAMLRGLKSVIAGRIPDVIVRPLFFAGCLGGLLLAHRSVSPAEAMMLHVIAAGFAFVLGGGLLAKFLPEQARASTEVYKTPEWLSTSAHLLGVALLGVLLTELDKILLGWIRPMTEVGLYSAASRLAYFALFSFDAVGVIAAPLVAETFSSKSRESFERLLQHMSEIMALATLPIILILLFCGNYILGAFGAEYREAHNILLALSLAQLGNIAFGPSGYALTMTGNQKAGLQVLLGSVVLAVPVFLLGIWLYGALGLAVAVGAIILIRNSLTWWAVKRNLNVDGSLFSAISRRVRLEF